MVEKTGSEALGDLIRERREAKGWTRRDLAEQTGLSYPYISQLETAYRLPSSRAMQVLARALDIEAGDLFDALPEDAALSVPAPSRTTGSAIKPGRTGGPTSRQPSATSRAAPPDDDRWITNPAHKKPAYADIPAISVLRGEASGADAVRHAVGALESLAPDERLAALQEVQAAVVAGIVRDQRRG